MAQNAFFAAAVVLLAGTLWLLQECRFLIPYRRLIVTNYASPIGLFAGLLFVNLFALFYYAGRKLFLKDTGRKLAHLERQLRAGETLEELARRLEE